MPQLSKKKTEVIEDEHGRKLTNRQKTFAEYVVEGIYSNAQAARMAGYAVEFASEKASVLTNGRDFPHVLEYIKELREEKERKYGVTMAGQLERLHNLSRGAEKAGSFSAAINAEKIRSALGGLTVDRREQVNSIDSMSRDDIVARLVEMQRKYPQAFQIEGTMKDVTNGDRPRGELLESDSVELAEGIERAED